MEERVTRLKFQRTYRSDGALRCCDVVDQGTGDALRILRLDLPREKSSVVISLILLFLLLAEGAGLAAYLLLEGDETSYILPVGAALFVACAVLLVLCLDPQWRFRALHSGGAVAFELISSGSRWVRQRRFFAHGANGQAFGWLMRTSIWPPYRNWVCYSINGEAICQTVLTRAGLGWFRRCLALVCPGRFGVYQYVSHGRTVGVYDCWHSTLSLTGDEALPSAFAISIGVFLNSPYWA